MSEDWGLRISKRGKNVLSDPDTDMVFSSKFDNLKIHTRGSGSISDSTGRTVTIPHNLGYVPVFIVHSQPDAFYGTIFSNMAGKYQIAPIQPIATDIGSPYFWGNREITVWSDTTNIYIKLDDDFGYIYAFPESDNDFGEDVGFYVNGSARVGYSEAWDHRDRGAIRFANVTTHSSVYKATLGFYLGIAEANSTPIKVYGIDEDNTGDFGNDPFGRNKTDAFETSTRDAGLRAGTVWAFGVTSPFNEVITRGGFSSGNHVGFFLEDNNSVKPAGIYTAFYDSGFPFFTPRTYLKWLQNNLLTNYRYTIFKNKLTP